MDPVYHAKREEEKKNKEAIKYAKPKYQANRQQTAASSDWTPDAWARAPDAWANYQATPKGQAVQNQSWTEGWTHGGYKQGARPGTRTAGETSG